MSICAIVTEYNPFHLGHEYQIQQVRKQLDAEAVIVIMSGHFVQRGEPAIFDKWTRTRLALAGGADIVIELPTLFATASAETFAYGAVELIKSLGVVDKLCFGSESGEIGSIRDLAKFLAKEPANYKNALKSELKKGYSFPKARSLAIASTYPHERGLFGQTHPHVSLDESKKLMKGSNNILGIEYVKALDRLKSDIEPYTIKRVGASYLSDSIKEVLPSATAIRTTLRSHAPDKEQVRGLLQHAMPIGVIEALMDRPNFTPVFMTDLFPLFKYLLEVREETDTRKIYDLPLDLFRRLKNQMRDAVNCETFMKSCTSKNYTRTTMQRSLLHLYLNILTSDMKDILHHGNSYIRILGFSKCASNVLHDMKKKGTLPLVTNAKDHQRVLTPYGQEQLLREIHFTNLYNQIITNKYGIQKKNDYQESIIVQ